MNAINNTPFPPQMPPVPQCSPASILSASQLSQHHIEYGTEDAARPKTNAEWLESVDALIERAAEEIRQRETLARLAFLHSQITLNRRHGVACPEMVEEYAVLAA